MNKSPKTKVEIQDMVTAELRRCAGCEEAWGVVVVGLDSEITGATWTVSRFLAGSKLPQQRGDCPAASDLCRAARLGRRPTFIS